MAVIYGIECQVTRMVYVGFTGNLSKRWREHRCLLRAGKHAETAMQADWLLHGEAAFRVHQLTYWPSHYEPTLAEKRAAELKQMDEYEARGLLYNRSKLSFALSHEATRKGAANAHNERGNRWTPEANTRRSLAQLGRPKGHGAKISATKRAKRASVE